MLKNSKVVLFVTLKSWSGRKLLDPTTYHYLGDTNGGAIGAKLGTLQLLNSFSMQAVTTPSLSTCIKIADKIAFYAFPPHPKSDSALCQESSYRIPQLCPGHTVPRLHYTSSPYNTKGRGAEVGDV